MQPVNILIVEDEVIVAKDIELTLKQLGYSVTGVAASTESAVELFRETNPDLVLMDIMLQNNNDGVQTTRRLLQMRPVPVIYLTAYADQATLDRAKQTSPYGYLLKPFQEQELRTSIEMALYKFSMERELQLKERWLTATLEHIGDAVLTLDREGRISYANQPAAQLLETTQDKLIDKQVATVPGDLPQKLSQLQGTSEIESKTGIIETTRNDKILLYIEYTATPILNSSRELDGYAVIFRDHTAQITSEIALRRSEKQYRQLIERSPYGIVVHHRGEILFINKAAAAIFGAENRKQLLPQEGRPGSSLNRFFSATTLRDLEQQYKAPSDEGSPVSLIEGSVSKIDGSVTAVEAAVIPVSFQQKNCIHLMIHDITERKILEDNLRQSQKMEAVGRLAGGVAHDFNNLLTAIIGYNDLALLNAEPDSDLHMELTQIQQASERASALTSQLLAFSRRQVLNFTTLNINLILTEMEKLLRRVIGEDVALKFIKAEQLWSVTADAGQLQQVVMNLAINARDAMPDGGEITITTANSRVDHPQKVYQTTLPEGEYVKLSVHDNGIGMDPYVLEHLFEPFFTTKKVNRGTGLGLSSVYGIVHQSGGAIDLKSTKNGTVFHLYFPRTTSNAEQQTPTRIESKLPGGDETVILTEDDTTVRNLTKTMLTNHGYRVYEFPAAAEAIEFIKSNPQQFDLLLTDMVMPGISGLKFIDFIRQHHPAVKIMLMSGYLDRFENEQAGRKLPENFLQKPFTQEQLLRKVRSALDGSSPAD